MAYCSDTTITRIKFFAKNIQEELMVAFKYRPVQKDILIVTHNQLDYLKNCVRSIRENTTDYRIYVWDNASDETTQIWLKEQNIETIRNEENLGFIIPNNRLAQITNNPYIILLNDDTEVYDGWDKMMIGFLQQKDISQVGYLGGWLNAEGRGVEFGFGENVDYIAGWCFAISRQTYQEFGLFDESFKFAYCEDADFSLRLTEAGKKIYSLHAGLVHHYENATIKSIETSCDVRSSFEANHSLLRSRWKNRLETNHIGKRLCSDQIVRNFDLQDGQSAV